MSLIKNKKDFREYLILISPPEYIKERIKMVKELFGEKYNLTHQVEQPANIPVMNLQMNKNDEVKLIEILKNFCKDEESFTINLSGYAGFRPHTIYIKVAEEKTITGLHKRLKQAIIPKLYLETWQIGSYANPHMTVARNLTEEIFNKAIGEYRSRKLELNFKADNLTLLWREKKFSTKIKKWQGKETFKFGQSQESLFE